MAEEKDGGDREGILWEGKDGMADGMEEEEEEEEEEEGGK